MAWKPMKSTVNAEANTVSTLVPHFSLYTLAGKPGLKAVNFLKQGERLKEFKDDSWQGKPALKVVKTRPVKLFWFIDMEMEIETYIDPETEQVVEERKPWWSFLTGTRYWRIFRAR